MEAIFHGNSNLSGVYKIVNLINRRIYIGSAKEFKERFKGHLSSLRRNKAHNRFFQADFNKCGEENFVFEVIEVVNGTKEERFLREQYWIDQFYDDQINCYNFKKEAKGTNEGIKTKEESKLKLSNSCKEKWKNNPELKEHLSRVIKDWWKNNPQHKEALSNRRNGSKASKETRKKMSLVHKNRIRKPHSEETKRKMSEVKRGKSNGPRGPYKKKSV